MNLPLFVLNSKSHRGLTKFNLRPKQLEWLEEDRQKIVNRMSVVMRKNKTSTTNFGESAQLTGRSKSSVVWEDLPGQEGHRAIKFKVIITRGAARLNRYLFAVPPSNNQKLFNFRVYEQIKFSLVQQEMFTNDERDVVGLELDEIDNRVVRFKKLDPVTNWMVERHVTFSSVYERNYFHELFFAGTKEREPQLAQQNELRMLVSTYNQGQKNVTAFKEMEKQFGDMKEYSVVVFASQECRKKYRLERALEIENYMIPRGFVNIDSANQMNVMFEMYIIIYVRRELIPDVKKVTATRLEKGLWGMVGNKGAVAYSFKIKNRLFNFIACHLRHG